jgi:hypothetical protein
MAISCLCTFACITTLITLWLHTRIHTYIYTNTSAHIQVHKITHVQTHAHTHTHTLANTHVQALLARFSQENSLLARENDRLNQGRVALGAEHSDVLDEIEMLRERLSGLESAVKTGHAPPGAIKVCVYVRVCLCGSGVIIVCVCV